MNWIRIGESIVGVSNEGMFGKVVSLSGNGTVVAISSSPGNNVYIYEVSSTYTRYSVSFSEKDSETFGTDIDLSSDGAQLIVGAPGDGNGKSYLYLTTSSSSQT